MKHGRQSNPLWQKCHKCKNQRNHQLKKQEIYWNQFIEINLLTTKGWYGHLDSLQVWMIELSGSKNPVPKTWVLNTAPCTGISQKLVQKLSCSLMNSGFKEKVNERQNGD